MTLHAYAVALCVALLSGLAHSYPVHWAEKKANDCTAVPTVPFDLSAAPHTLPAIDDNITIAIVSASDGSPVTTLCPGGVYNLTVSLPPGPGHHLLVSTYGAFSSNICLNSQVCKNRACNCDHPGSSSCPLDDTTLTNQITMPCDSSIADGTSNVFRVVYMLNSEAILGTPLRTNTLTTTISSVGCPTCTPPPPPPSPPAEKPSITVKATPASIKVGAISTLRATIKGVMPPMGDEVKKAKVTVMPSGVVKCTPATPKVTAKNQVVVKCKGVKKGSARVSVTYSEVENPGTGNKISLKVTA